MTKVIISVGFRRQAKQLRKKYPNILRDITPLIAQLERGETPGDRLQRIDHVVYKVRVANSDAQRGKSGGYRVVYYIRTSDKLFLLLVYSKTQHEDVPDALIVDAIQEILDDEQDSDNRI